MNKLKYWRSDWLLGGLNRAKAMSGAMVLGGAAGGGHCGSTVIPPGGGVEKSKHDLAYIAMEFLKCVASAVNKALAKDPVARYQDGGQMARALHHCRQSVSAHGAPAATAAVGTGT